MGKAEMGQGDDGAAHSVVGAVCVGGDHRRPELPGLDQESTVQLLSAQTDAG